MHWLWPRTLGVMQKTQNMNIIEIIKKRKSCRTFNNIILKSADKRDLESYINENKKLIDNEVIDIGIFEKYDASKKMKLNYGAIQGHNTYLLGTSKSTIDSRVNYGYLLEKVVLKATEIGISTCWIGYFDNTYFNEIIIEQGFEIPSIVILGYSNGKQTNLDKFSRFAVNASVRFGWEKLFLNYNSKMPLMPDSVKSYTDSLEMVRLGPSSGNTQPWRIFFDDTTNEFHFFKKRIKKRYEEKGLHDIDMGIALSHFELTSLNNNLSGNWIKHAKENVNSIADLQYIITWKCK
jgi:nitroreductase